MPHCRKTGQEPRQGLQVDKTLRKDKNEEPVDSFHASRLLSYNPQLATSI